MEEGEEYAARKGKRYFLFLPLTWKSKGFSTAWEDLGQVDGLSRSKKKLWKRQRGNGSLNFISATKRH